MEKLEYILLYLLIKCIFIIIFIYYNIMLTSSLCGPAILYIGFSLIQIVIDLYKKLFSSAFIKMIVMLILALTINVLCEMGLTLIAWFLVFVPIIMMTIISTLLLKTFGTNPDENYLKSKVNTETSNTETSNVETGNVESSNTETNNVESSNTENNFERIDRDKKRQLFYDKIEILYDLSSNENDLYDLSNNENKYFIVSNLINNFENNYFTNFINNIYSRFTHNNSNLYNNLNSYNNMINPLYGYSNTNTPYLSSLPMTQNSNINTNSTNENDFESYESRYDDSYNLDGRMIYDSQQRRQIQIQNPNFSKEQIDMEIENLWNNLTAAEQLIYNREASSNQSDYSIYDPTNLTRYRNPLIALNYRRNSNTPTQQIIDNTCPPGKERNSLGTCVLPCPVGQERINGTCT